jgi:hypothetical protein
VQEGVDPEFIGRESWKGPDDRAGSSSTGGNGTGRVVTRGVGFGRPCQGKRRESGRRRRTLSLVSVCVCVRMCVFLCIACGSGFCTLVFGKNIGPGGDLNKHNKLLKELRSKE